MASKKTVAPAAPAAAPTAAKVHASLYLDPTTARDLDEYAAENGLSKSVAADRLIAQGIAGAAAGATTAAGLAPFEEMLRRALGDHLELFKEWLLTQTVPLQTEAQVGRILAWYLVMQLYGQGAADATQEQALATVAYTLRTGQFFRAGVKGASQKKGA